MRTAMVSLAAAVGVVAALGACDDEDTSRVVACQPVADSDLGGVSLAWKTTDCEYTLAEAAAGLGFAWEVVTTAPVPDVVALPQDAGGCGAPDASGLIVFPRVVGASDGWCICDEGLCQAPGDETVTLPAGTYAGSFAWDGVNWAGPSDTGNPKGAPFGPGTYTVSLSAKGTVAGTPFEVRVSVPITLVP
jgi:hypothetical protein